MPQPFSLSALLEQVSLLRERDWLWVRPGQVQQWGDLDQAEGRLVLFEHDFLDPATAAAARLDDLHAPALLTPLTEDREALQAAAAHLQREFDAFGSVPLEVHVLILRQLLGALVLRAAHIEAPGSPAADPGEACTRFRTAVDRDFTRVRRIDDYARDLGYSARTLSRATLAVDGVTAKEFVDRRVLLEAKRLLAHSDSSAARIAAQLGFSSATHFAKFFHRHTGRSPLTFRRAIRGQESAVQAAPPGRNCCASVCSPPLLRECRSTRTALRPRRKPADCSYLGCVRARFPAVAGRVARWGRDFDVLPPHTYTHWPACHHSSTPCCRRPSTIPVACG